MAGYWNVVTDINILLQAVFQEGNWIITEIVQSKRKVIFFITKYIFIQLIHKRYGLVSFIYLYSIFLCTFTLGAWLCSKISILKNIQVINVNNGNNRKDNKINWIRRNFMALACFFSFSQQLETKAITRTKNTKKAFYTVTIVPRWYNMSYEMVLCITQATKSIRISSKLCSVSIVELVTKLYLIGQSYKTILSF